MRFIQQEHLITTIHNEEIVQAEKIKSLLTNLKKESIEFSFIVKNNTYHGYSNQKLSYDKAKVKKINEDSADFFVFHKTAINNINDIKFEDILEISAITEKNRILEHNDKVERWDLMDIEE